MKIIVTLATTVACALVLSACGGGGGDDSTVATNNSGGGSSQSAGTGTGSGDSGAGTGNSGSSTGTDSGGSGASTGSSGDSGTGAGSGSSSYAGLTPATDATSFLAQINQEGAKGYRYLYDQSFGVACTDNVSSDPSLNVPCPPSPSPISVFINDGAAPSYTYELQSNPGNIASFITQANAEGAQGYRFSGWYGTPVVTGTTVTPPPYALYRKDGGSIATYTYATDTAGPVASTDIFLTQVNTRGKSGYWFYGQIGLSYPAPANLYVKNNASNATYAYAALTLLPLSSQQPQALAQFNSEGAAGYMPTYTLTPNVEIPSSSSYVLLYMKDQTQSANFVFQSTTQVSENGTDLINQLNNFNTQGYSASWAGSGVYLYYFKATNCNGWLCSTRDPAVTAAGYSS